LKKTGRKIVVEKSSKDAIVDLQYSAANSAEFQYLAMRMNGKLNTIYTWGDQCKNRPCYLLAHSAEFYMVNVLMPGRKFNPDGMISLPLTNSNNSDEVQRTSFNPPLSVSGEIAILPFPLPDFGASIAAEFQDNFYPTERGPSGLWRWSFGAGVINLKSPGDNEIALFIRAVPAASGQGWLILPDGRKTDLFGGTCIMTRLKRGDNKLKAIVDYPPVRLDRSDPRSFTFKLRGLYIGKTCD
jgi:hypothetical protein